jgi:energy-coupling factor transporter ATP-binding protein EcfA2
MPNNLLERGSIWHKWNLHIHGPLSALSNQFPKLPDGSPDWEKYLKALAKVTDTPAVAITDYFMVESYRKVREAKASGKLPNIEIVLPNIEFRINNIINTKNGPRRLNYHLLFSDKVSVQDIEEHFLHEIKFQYEGEPQRQDLSLSVRRTNLEMLGKRLKEEHEPFNDGRSDFEIGCMNATVDPEDIKRVLRNKEQIFGGKYLILLPEEHTSLMEWNGQDHQTRKVLLQGADGILSKNPKTVQWALGGGDPITAGKFIKEFKSLKPCLGGCDAHNLEKLGKPDLNRCCWIKSDLTFEGLKQVLYEPKERVYFGDAPPNLKNAYQVIDSISLTGCPDWFGDIAVPLNPDLVSVIGPRGSGKSALAEMIAFACGSNVFRPGGDVSDSFLTKASKRSASNLQPIVGMGIAVRWADGHESLATIVSPLRTTQDEEEVKYLPQKFVDHLCAPENNQELEQEIERVIYQRHQKVSQSDASNFQELRRSATQALQTRRTHLAQTIRSLNQSIAVRTARIDELKQKETDSAKRKAELETVVNAAPTIPEANRADINRLSELQMKRMKTVEEINQLNRQSGLLENAAAKYEILKGEILQFNRDISEMLAASGVNELQKCLVQLPPAAALEAIASRRLAISVQLTKLQGSSTDSSEDAISGVDKSIAAIRGSMTLAENKQKEYEKNQADRKKLEGVITGLERDIKEIKEVQKLKRTEEVSARMDTYLDAIDLLGQEVKVLSELYKPLHDALANANETANRLGFVTQVIFDAAGHASRGMELFDRRRSIVRDEETLCMKLTKFFDDISSQEFDRENNRTAVEQLRGELIGTGPMHDQLREKRSPQDFADWFFDICPFGVTYTLEYDHKDLKYLSPGEKGIVLLLLYLEAEEDDHRPLIIDQPDDNLDNLSIFPSLVDYFRARKCTRQILIITHNPNLVVTTDSEQIVIGDFDGARAPRVQYRSGSLENTSAPPQKGVREEVCLILEGGVDAFRIRENRYDLRD